MRAEFTAEQWVKRPSVLRRRRAIHEGCDGRCGHVFRCRGWKKACGRYFGACMGGDGNLCNRCWCRREKEVEAKGG